MERNVLYGGDVLEDLAKGYKSLGEFFSEKLHNSNNETEIVDAKTGSRLTRKQLIDRIERLAGYMSKIGIKPGHHVAIVSENRFEFPVVVLSAIFCGAPVSALSASYSKGELQHALNIIQPRVIFISPAVQEKVKDVLQKINLKSILIQFDEGGFRRREPFNFSDIIKSDAFKPKRKFRPPKIDSSKHVGIILLSSGTTGMPKCVQLTHRNLLSGFAGTMEIFENFRKNKDVALTIVPWAHNFGLITFLRLLAFGIKVISLQRFEEELYLKAIETYNVSVCYVAPPLMVWFSKAPILDKYNVKSIRTLYSGGAPLSMQIVSSILRRFPNVQVIRNGYGMTETSTGAISADSRVSKTNSIGVLWKGFRAKVVDQETGDALPCNKPGELCFKGNQIMLGYMKNEEETANAIDADGWLHTGDIVYYDKDKEFFIVGRIKELIKYKGFQVPPVELEAILLGHPDVRDAAVFGIPDDIAGELPMAVVVLKPNVSVDKRELIDFVDKQVSGPKKLRGGIKIVDEVPKNANGKIMRRALTEKYGKYQKTNSKL